MRLIYNQRLMMPVISVVIPAYNAAETLERALVSVAVQSLADIEIIVVDDGSTDDTPRLLRDRAALDPRMRALTQANGGVARARNAGIAAARAEWVATIDADDLWHPRKLELQLAAAAAAGEACTMVYAWSRRIDMDDRVIAEHFLDASANYRGSSWSVYDSLSDRWQQTWVDNQGNYFALSGAWMQDRMVLETRPAGTEGRRFYRMVFRDIERDGFWWEWSVTEDKGATWTQKWRIRYTRI